MSFIPIWAFWLAFALLLFGAEILTAGFFLFPFGVGAVGAAVADLAGLSLLWQWAIFLVTSAVCLAFSRPLAGLFDRSPDLRAGADRLIGMDGIVTRAIDPDLNGGEVRVDNERWRAEPADGGRISEGARVTVLAIKGARVVVRSK